MLRERKSTYVILENYSRDPTLYTFATQDAIKRKQTKRMVNEHESDFEVAHKNRYAKYSSQREKN